MKLRNAKKSAEVQNAIIEKLVDLYEAEGINEVNELNIQEDGLTVILFVGVNGVGKTTSIGKLAHQFKNEGKKVLMAAADTFRAGAIDQLVVWANALVLKLFVAMQEAIQQLSYSMLWKEQRQSRQMFY